MINFVTMNFVMKNLVAFNHALSDATRWRIVRLLLNEPLCVCELADILDMPQSSVSSHVQVIKKSDMLESEKCEKWIYYQVKPAHRTLIMSIERFFEASPSTDQRLKTDAANAVKRLAERGESCCPLPKSLPGRKSGQSAENIH